MQGSAGARKTNTVSRSRRSLAITFIAGYTILVIRFQTRGRIGNQSCRKFGGG